MKNNLKFAGIICLLTILLIAPMISSEGINYCCEKTLSGAWCLPDAQSNCDPAFLSAPTSCDSTSYCKRGCCYDSKEGTCDQNTPQRVCADSGGTWSDEPSCVIPQCELGCCILGDQAALVTMARCKSLSGFYGLITDFRKDITDEVQCIMTANSQDKGACVSEDPQMHALTCKFTTRGDCGGIDGVVGTNESGKRFYKDTLCSAEELGTVCGQSTKTMLVEGKDEIYFQDTCGNPANIYDAKKSKDKAYWTKVYTKDESCGSGSSNANSASCGNCDYFLGSMAKKKAGATYGDYICVDLGCKGHKHGESWCESDNGGVGDRYYKQICLNNEVLVEPCADFKDEICIQNSMNGFSEAACVVNRWQDCVLQQEQQDCENSDKRDCKWIEGYYFTEGKQVQFSVKDEKNNKKITPTGLCAPKYPSGQNFWGDSTDNTAKVFTNPSASKSFNATSNLGTGAVTPAANVNNDDLCGLGSSTIKINFEKTKKGGFADWSAWKCLGEDVALNYNNGKGIEICKYFTADKLTDPEGLAKEFNTVCSQLGDCGENKNWIGNKGSGDGYALYYSGERVAGSGGAEVLTEQPSVTAQVIKDYFKEKFGGQN